MPNETFNYNGATIHVRESIGRDELDAVYPRNALIVHIAKQMGITDDTPLSDLPDNIFSRANFVIEAIMRSEIEGDLHLPIAQHIGDKDAVITTYEALMLAPRKLVKAWERALSNADFDIPDPNV